jgi:hypothetical protein
MLSHLSVCLQACASVRRSVTLGAVLTCIAIGTQPAKAQTQEAALNIPDGIFTSASNSLRNSESSTIGKPRIADTTGSLRLFAATLKGTDGLGLGTSAMIHRLGRSATPSSVSALTQFSIVIPAAYRSLAVSYDTSFRLGAPHRAQGAWRPANWILKETLGDDGIRQIKQGLDRAKRVAFR